MPSFSSEGIEIAYEVWGSGKPVMFVHGFGSNFRVNWVDTGWIETVTSVGYQAIAFDNRGHGRSGKFYDPSLYRARLMAHDAVNLLDHLGFDRAAFVGYSMGARISAFAAIDAPRRVAAAVFGGMGANMMKSLVNSEAIIAALRADAIEHVPTRIGRQYRAFADRSGSDREALAACMLGGREAVPPEDLKTLRQPILVAVGSEDDISGPAEPLAALIGTSETLIIPGRDHMRATGDKVFKSGVLDFLDRVW